MRHSILLSAAIILGLTVTSCKKNDNSYNGNSPTGTQKPQMNYQLVAANPNGSVQKGTAVANLQWTAGFANPSMVKFEAKQGGTEIEYKSTTDQQIDLMSSVALTFGNFTIPPGTYDEIELKIELDKRGSGPALQLSGQYSDGTTTLPVLVQIDENIEIKTELEDVTITDNSSFTAVTTIDLDLFTSNLTTAQILNATLTNGTLVISSHSNKALYLAIVNSFRNKRHHCEFHHH